MCWMNFAALRYSLTKPKKLWIQLFLLNSYSACFEFFFFCRMWDIPFKISYLWTKHPNKMTKKKKKKNENAWLKALICSKFQLYSLKTMCFTDILVKNTYSKKPASFGSSQDADANAQFQKRISSKTGFMSGRKGRFFIEKWIFSRNGAALKSIFSIQKRFQKCFGVPQIARKVASESSKALLAAFI